MQENDVSINKRKEAQNKIYTDIRAKLESNDIKGAEELIELVPDFGHDAEWHFLKGCILTHNGWFHDAQIHFETARRLEPHNPEYNEAVNSLDASSNGYKNTWSGEAKAEPRNKEKSKREKNCICCIEGGCECLCEGICEACDGI